MLFPEDDAKRYYTIGEVAELFQVSKSLIRFWESEFDFLKPHKMSNGERRFTKENLQQFQLIHHLVKEKGFTLAGAKQEIKTQSRRLQQKMKIINKLTELKAFLLELKKEV